MNTVLPLLFLDSPNVGVIGHAYVISRDASRVPIEAELTEVANLARGDKVQNEFIASKRSVVQHDTGRHAEEILICSNAVPANPEDGATVRKVLTDLLEKKILPGVLQSGHLSKQSGLIYSAPCMDEIVKEFHADSRIQQIPWRPSTAKAVPPDVQSPPKPKKTLMKWLAVLLLLAVVPMLQKRKADPGSNASPNPVPAAPSDAQEAEAWAFLITNEWPRLMEATNGQNALKALQELQMKFENAPTSDLPEGVLKRLPNAFRSEPDKKRAPTHADPKPAMQLVNRWADLFLLEFSDSEANSSQAKELRVKESQLAKILIQSKANKDGRSISSVSGWITDYQNQRKNYPEELKQCAQRLEDFLSAVQSKSLDEAPDRLRIIWNALEVYGKAKIEPGEDTGFQDIVNANMRPMTSPPENFATLTLQDSKRVEVLRKILGAPEFGLVLIGSRLGASQADWGKIRSQIGAVAGGIQQPSAASRLKMTLAKQFLEGISPKAAP